MLLLSAEGSKDDDLELPADLLFKSQIALARWACGKIHMERVDGSEKFRRVHVGLAEKHEGARCFRLAETDSYHLSNPLLLRILNISNLRPLGLSLPLSAPVMTDSPRPRTSSHLVDKICVEYSTLACLHFILDMPR